MISRFRLLIRPTLFTASVCGTSFCAAAIVEHENKASVNTLRERWNNIITTKRQQIRDDGYQTGQKIAIGIIGLNALVLLAWKTNRFMPIMTKYFMLGITLPKIRLSPMLLSAFSHQSVLHISFNMLCLMSFAQYTSIKMGPEPMCGFYMSAAAVSSLTSLAFKANLLSKSLGASGAIIGIIGYLGVAAPQTRVKLFMFMDMNLGDAVKCLLAFDTIGLLWTLSRGAGLLDHAGHLGGCLFGILYGLYGEKLYHKYKSDVVDTYLALKGRRPRSP